MKVIYPTIFGLLISILFSCQKEIDPNLLANGNYEVSISEKIIFQDMDLCIYFEKVLAESRCPEDILCLSPGQVHIRVIVSSEGLSDTLAFSKTANNFHDQSLDMKEFNNFEITLIEVFPLSMQSTFDESKYFAHFRIN